MTDLDLTTLKSALKKATAGEWRTQNCPSGGLLLRRDTQMQSHLQIVPAEDAAFIALARTQLPALIAAYERQMDDIVTIRAETWKEAIEAAAKVADARDLSIMSSTIVDAEACKIAAAIRAIPLPEPKP